MIGSGGSTAGFGVGVSCYLLHWVDCLEPRMSGCDDPVVHSSLSSFPECCSGSQDCHGTSDGAAGSFWHFSSKAAVPLNLQMQSGVQVVDHQVGVVEEVVVDHQANHQREVLAVG